MILSARIDTDATYLCARPGVSSSVVSVDVRLAVRFDNQTEADAFNHRLRELLDEAKRVQK